MAAPAPTLDDARAEIDRIDQSIHDLLMRRVEIVRGIGRLKGAAAPKWRPAREAALIRRLAARHRGAMPLGVLVRIWREMIIGGSLALQEKVAVAVAESCWDLARDHFGAAVPLRPRRSSDLAARDVVAGRATIGVLAVGEAGARWWRTLARRGTGAARVVARLPFAGGGNGRSAGGAFAIAPVAFEPSGRDRSLLVVEAKSGAGAASIVSALRRAGFAPRRLARDAAATGVAALLEVEGFVADDDARLAALRIAPRLGRVAPIGGYAVPLS